MKRKISKIAIGLFVAAWCSLFPFGMITAYADTTDVNASEAEVDDTKIVWDPYGDGSFRLIFNKKPVVFTMSEYNIENNQDSQYALMYCYIENTQDADITVQVSSTNAGVIKLPENMTKFTVSEKCEYDPDFDWWNASFDLSGTITGYGKTTIKYAVGEHSFEKEIWVLPQSIDVTSIKQSGYNTAKLKWEKYPDMSGYVIERALIGENGTIGEYQSVKTVEKNTNTVEITLKNKKNYRYRVIGYVDTNGEKVLSGNYGTTLDFQLNPEPAQIKSIKTTGSSHLKLTWEKMKGATGYKVYRSATENDGYKCVYTAKSGKTTSWKQKVTKGKTYYYYVVTIYPNGKTEASQTVAQIYPKTSKEKVHTIKGMEDIGVGSQYNGNWATSDRVYYYELSGKMHVVCAGENCVTDYTLNSKGNVSSKKTIKIKYERWGGFYKGTDGKFYVAVGYNNPKESSKKTVIKVIQYTNKWKKLKTASIKGGASNAFEGIYIPFDAGNCTMAMNGNELYLFTAREMFMRPDGLHHQSNISFRINTKTMKAKEANESYVSHSFNQYVKYKDGDLYLLDHGDAYPRSLCLTAVKDSDTNHRASYESNFFPFLQGENGEHYNYTGCTVGGMEVGNKNILICGASVPHENKVKGVTGAGTNYKKNVYVVIVNRETGKSKIKWLTSYHPLKTTTTVGNTRMVKLAEDRYAILYSTKKNDVETVHYLVINNAGKKIYSKSYKGMSFSGGTQPMLYKGNLVWVEEKGGFDYESMQYVYSTNLYQIPAITEKK